MTQTDPVHVPPGHVIGGGLAGSEAAWQLARAGVPVVLHEMRPVRKTDAHSTDGLAELVCSNSFRSDDADSNAVGLLHEELRRCDSVIMRAADIAKLGRSHVLTPVPKAHLICRLPLEKQNSTTEQS